MSFQTNIDYKNASEKINSVVDEIEKVVVGKREEIIMLVTAMISGSHVLIEDVPGTGKTTLASTIAKVTGLYFKRAQFTPDVMASDITGFNIYNRQKENFEFREGLVMCNLLLADEINRASPKTQSALLEAMEENRVTVDGVTYDVPDPFMVIATQNPVGYVGTYPLPEAQLDRFAIKLTIGYPSPSEEVNIIRARRGFDPLDNVESVINIEELKKIRDTVNEIHIDDSIYRYIVSLITATRVHSHLSLGASPRASVALMRLSQAYAFIKGRNYVLPDDVAALFRVTVGHRLLLKQEAKLNNITVDEVINSILRTTEVPMRADR